MRLFGVKSCALTLLILTICFASNVLAEDLEVTLFGGYAFGGGFENSINGESVDLTDDDSFGAIVGVRDKSKPGSYYELLYMRQPSALKGDGTLFNGAPRFEVDIDYYHLGGSYRVVENPVNPFVSGGLGVTHFSPERGSGETRFSFSLGGGVKVPVTDYLALRLEGRGSGTLFNGNGLIFCNDTSCGVRVEGDLLWRFTGFAGVVLVF